MQRFLTENWQVAGFGLYVHWPFCQSKCPYCDFNSHVSRAVDHSDWRKALLSEIHRYGTETGQRRLSSIFFGGGTPSLMEPETVDAIIKAASDCWHFSNDIEITLEANPGSVERQTFAEFRSAGVNRVSLGVQALDDTDLKRLGRLHSVQDALMALDVARSTFDRVSFDLIYARQNQTFDMWKAELDRALSFDPDHLSLYQLTIEDGTAFGDLFRTGKLRGLPDEDLAADLYEITQSLTDAAGLPAYEVSNHARPGAESRHNLIYWRGGDWVGIGPGAHGRLTLGSDRIATETALLPAEWLDAARVASGEKMRQTQKREDMEAERLMMGLRLLEGVPLDRLNALQSDYFLNNINTLIEMGLICTADERLVATSKGRPVLNAILRELLPGND